MGYRGAIIEIYRVKGFRKHPRTAAPMVVGILNRNACAVFFFGPVISIHFEYCRWVLLILGTIQGFFPMQSLFFFFLSLGGHRVDLQSREVPSCHTLNLNPQP